jgi:two-component system sensor histidine kinase BaeS
MRSISVKITLVLVAVSLVGALFTTFYIQSRTRNAFDAFIKNQDQLALADLLVTHFEDNSSWENADILFQEFYRVRSSNFPGGGGQGKNPNRPGENLGPPPFVLTDPDGIVLLGLTNHTGFLIGDQIKNKDLQNSLPLEINGAIQGLLVPVPISPNTRNSMQQNFLGTVQQGLFISSLVTLLIALVLGGILITSFTRPIRKLADGTEKIASGDLGFQVEIKSDDELGRLAASFNNMSLDLQKADQQRKQMTADIAHDLRTPLSILHGYTEAMSEGKIAGNPEIYQAMHGQTRHLNYLIEDLRTLSLLDSEELSFQLENINPQEILKQTGTAFHPLAAKRDISLILDLEKKLPRVRLDPDRLTQILGNLVNNAINVLPDGGSIWLSAWQKDADLIIEVKDDGPGIAEEDLTNIFNRHYKIDRSRGQVQESSGLGLAIAKKLVEAQGGNITVNSEPGGGTAFRVSFPL